MEQARSKSHDQFFAQFSADVARTESVVSRPRVPIPMTSFVGLVLALISICETLNLIKRAAFYGAEIPLKTWQRRLTDAMQHISTASAWEEDLTTRSDLNMRLVHGLLGKITEVGGELGERLLSTIQDPTQVPDVMNIIEELGDDHYYGALVCMALDIDPSEPYFAVIRKLEKRYPEKFAADRAVNRDLGAEAAALLNHGANIKQVDPSATLDPQGNPPLRK